MEKKEKRLQITTCWDDSELCGIGSEWVNQCKLILQKKKQLLWLSLT